MTPIVKFR